MAINIVRAPTNTADASQSFVFDMSTPATAGNVLLAFIGRRQSATLSIPAGWTKVGDILSNDTVTFSVAYLVAGAAEPASYTWTSTASYKWVGAVLELEGVNVSSIVDAFAINAGTNTSAVSPGITTTINGALVISSFSYENLNASSAIDPALMQNWRRESSAGAAIGIVGGSITQSALGPAGPYTSVIGSAVDWAACDIALTPVLAGPSYDGTFGPIDSKIGTVILNDGSIDANNRFTSSGGPLTTWDDGGTLPTGMQIDAVTGYIYGTLPATPDSFSVTITCADDNGPGTGSFTWNIEPYSIVFSSGDITALEDANGTFITTDNVVATVYSGWVTDGDSLSAHENFAGPLSIENGLLVLSPVTAGEGKYTVILKDTDEIGTVPLCAKQMISE